MTARPRISDRGKEHEVQRVAVALHAAAVGLREALLAGAAEHAGVPRRTVRGVRGLRAGVPGTPAPVVELQREACLLLQLRTS